MIVVINIMPTCWYREADKIISISGREIGRVVSSYFANGTLMLTILVTYPPQQESAS